MAILFAALVSACLLGAAFVVLGRLAASSRARRTLSHESAPAGRGYCPLCSSALGPGERVKSRLLPAKADRIMHIFGCVHCWPATPSIPRICPACGRALDIEGYVIARYFERPDRRHIHVLGCTGCRG
ncbi:MAG: hypothetical protein ABSF43_09295 [Rectinemataceae bacterium]